MARWQNETWWIGVRSPGRNEWALGIHNLSFESTAEVQRFLPWDRTSENLRIYYRCTPTSHTAKTSFATKQVDRSIQQEALEKLNPDIWRPRAPSLWCWHELPWVTNCFYLSFKRGAIFGLKLGLTDPWHLGKGQRFAVNTVWHGHRGNALFMF